MSRRHLPTLLVLCAILSLVASIATAGEVALSISAASGEWQVFAEVTETTSNESTEGSPITGIAAFSIDVVGSEGLTVTSSTNVSPIGESGEGFSLLRLDQAGATPGVGISGAQPTLFALPALVIDGFGLSPGSEGSVEWGFPVLLATGTYGGVAGTLTVSDNDPVPGSNGINLLFGAGGVWTGQEQGIGADVERAIVVTPGVVAIPPPLPADFDEDGDVDGEDFLAWQSGFFTPAGAALADGDADGDGDVDGEDFLIWQTHFGATNHSGRAAGSTVPELSSGIVAVGVFVVLGGLRRRATASRRHVPSRSIELSITPGPRQGSA